MLHRQNMSIMLSMSKKYGRKSSNWAQKPRTKQRAHKFYESLTCYQTAVMSCSREPLADGTVLAAEPPTGRWAGCFGENLGFEMYEDLKWRFTWKEKVDGPGWGDCVCVVDLKAVRHAESGAWAGPNPRAVPLYSRHHHLWCA